MADDVFSTETEGEQTNEGILESLVGPGKKFATVEDLAKGKAESDLFIEQLKLEKAQLSEGLESKEGELKKTATIAELIEAVKGVNSKGDDDNQPITPEQLQELVKSAMNREKTADSAQSNRERGNKLVLDKLEGNVEAAKAYVADRAKKLGMTPAQLAELSESSPDAFAELMDVKPSQGQLGPNGLPHQNSENLGTGTVLEIEGHHTKAWFDQQKKEMGLSKYVGNSKLQLAYMRAAQHLEDRF